MALTRTRPAFRRFALALAAAQLLAYGAASVLEAEVERNPGPAHIERAHSDSCVPIHAPASCIACQLLTVHVPVPAATRMPLRTDETRATEIVASLSVAPRAPPTGFLTRAPPITLG